MSLPRLWRSPAASARRTVRRAAPSRAVRIGQPYLYAVRNPANLSPVASTEFECVFFASLTWRNGSLGKRASSPLVRCVRVRRFHASAPRCQRPSRANALGTPAPKLQTREECGPLHLAKAEASDFGRCNGESPHTGRCAVPRSDRKQSAKEATRWPQQVERVNRKPVPLCRQFPHEYAIWAGMRQQCNNRKCREYRYYGGARHPRVPPVVRQERFQALHPGHEAAAVQAGQRPPNQQQPRLHAPGNVTWADATTQARHMRTNRVLTYKGPTEDPR